MMRKKRKMMNTEYTSEELVELVADLAQKYTSYESSSVSYTVARQLMEAVTYCISYGEKYADADFDDTLRALAAPDSLTAKQAYESGYQCIITRTKQAANCYNELIQYFDSYGSQCYQDTVKQGLFEFFRHYDPKFRPQDHMLTFDYPILISLDDMCGIERVEGYIGYIILEQQFLSQLPREYIISALNEYHEQYQELIINVCEVVVQKLLIQAFTGGQSDTLRKKVRDMSEEELMQHFTKLLRSLIDKMLLPKETDYQSQENVRNEEDKKTRLYQYLLQPVEDLVVRLYTARDSQSLANMAILWQLL